MAGPPRHPERTQPPGEARHAPGVALVLLVGAALVALTLATWLLARLPHGPWSLPVALLIAAAKAGLVGAVFMELKWRRGGSKVWAALALVLAGVLLLLGTLETARRFPPTVPPGPFGALEAPGETGQESRAPNRRAPEPRSP